MTFAYSDQADMLTLSLMSAMVQRAMHGLKPVGISALPIVVLELVGLIDKLLGLVSSWLGMAEPLSLVRDIGLLVP